MDSCAYGSCGESLLDQGLISLGFAPGCRESGDKRSMILSGKSLQQSDGNHTSIEVYISINPALKQQRCRNLCFWKFVSLHPICKIEVHLRSESFLSIRKYASYYGLPLLGRVVGQ